jgi:hypothetical protein
VPGCPHTVPIRPIEPNGPGSPSAVPAYVSLASINSDQGQLWFDQQAKTNFPALFGRFPGLALAVPAAGLTAVRTFLSNGHTALPVHLRAGAGTAPAG